MLMKRLTNSIRGLASCALVFSIGIGTGLAAETQEPVPILAALQSVKFSSLLQVWYVDDETLKTGSNFRVRRAEIKFEGSVLAQASWFIVIDPTFAGTLKDIAIVLKDENHLPGLSLQAGQFKVPFGMEGTASSGKIDTVERSMLSSILKWSDFRDRGVMGIAKYKAGEMAALTGYLGVFNGEGANANDVNNNKDVVGRVTADLPQGVHVGGSFYKGTNGTTLQDYEHYGGELAYTPPQTPLMLKAEAATGKQGGASTLWTYYVLAGYTFWDKLQPVVRWDVWGIDNPAINTLFPPAPNPAPNTADWQREITYGLNYFIKGHNAKIQAAYTIHTQNTINGAGDVGGTDKGIFRLASQIMF